MEGVPFVGNDASAHNLLQKGRPLIMRRHTVPVALSLCVNPMPSRITRKSTRPRVADRTMVDTVQPRVLASFRNRSALSLLMNMQLLRWSTKPETTEQATRLERHSYLTWDWMPRTITAPGGGRRMFLTSPLIEPALLNYGHRRASRRDPLPQSPGRATA